MRWTTWIMFGIGYASIVSIVQSFAVYYVIKRDGRFNWADDGYWAFFSAFWPITMPVWLFIAAIPKVLRGLYAKRAEARIAANAPQYMAAHFTWDFPISSWRD